MLFCPVSHCRRVVCAVLRYRWFFNKLQRKRPWRAVALPPRDARAPRALDASRDQKHLAETRTSMVVVDRGKAAAPPSPSTPPQPPPAPPCLPPGWEQLETEEGEMYYHNAATAAPPCGIGREGLGAGCAELYLRV